MAPYRFVARVALSETAGAHYDPAVDGLELRLRDRYALWPLNLLPLARERMSLLRRSLRRKLRRWGGCPCEELGHGGIEVRW